MARVVKPLTDTQIINAKPREKDYTLADGNGLHLLVKSSGKKLWEFVYKSPTLLDKSGNKKRRKTSFGNYPDVPLKTAREKRGKFLNLIADGIDPIDKKAKEKAEKIKKEKNKFKTITEEWLEFEEKRTTPATHKRKKRIIENDVYPFLQNKTITDITHQDLIAVIKARLSKKIQVSEDNTNAPNGIETANKLYNYLNTIFKYAITMGYTESNPMDNILKDLVIPKSEVTHQPKITEDQELKQLIRDIYSYDGHFTTKNALKLAIHIPLRAYNLVNLLWDYVDFENKSLTIPRKEMKVKDKNLPDFKVPLSDEVVTILKEQYQYTYRSKYVFLSNNSKPLSANTPNIALTKMGYKNKQTLHGFRGVFSSLAITHEKEHSISKEVRERFLDHHEKNKVQKAYDHRAEYFEQLKPLVKWWSNYVEGLL